MHSNAKQAKSTSTTDAPWMYHNPQAKVAPPSHDNISRRAYAIYLNMGFKQGQCKQNWLRAESELQEEYMTKFNARR